MTLIDLFGDGWGDDALWYIETENEVLIDSGAPYCSSNTVTKQICGSRNETYYMFVISQRDNKVPRNHWEILWKVEILSTGENFVGGYNTTMVLSYDADGWDLVYGDKLLPNSMVMNLCHIKETSRKCKDVTDGPKKFKSLKEKVKPSSPQMQRVFSSDGSDMTKNFASSKKKNSQTMDSSLESVSKSSPLKSYVPSTATSKKDYIIGKEDDKEALIRSNMNDPGDTNYPLDGFSSSYDTYQLDGNRLLTRSEEDQIEHKDAQRILKKRGDSSQIKSAAQKMKSSPSSKGKTSSKSSKSPKDKNNKKSVIIETPTDDDNAKIYVHMYDSSGKGWYKPDYSGTSFYISDDSKTELIAYGTLENGTYSGYCEYCFREGSYYFRVGPAWPSNRPGVVDNWFFCHTNGTAGQELAFHIENGNCVPDVVVTSENLCTKAIYSIVTLSGAISLRGVSTEQLDITRARQVLTKALSSSMYGWNADDISISESILNNRDVQGKNIAALRQHRNLGSFSFDIGFEVSFESESIYDVDGTNYAAVKTLVSQLASDLGTVAKGGQLSSAIRSFAKRLNAKFMSDVTDVDVLYVGLDDISYVGAVTMLTDLDDGSSADDDLVTSHGESMKAAQNYVIHTSNTTFAVDAVMVVCVLSIILFAGAYLHQLGGNSGRIAGVRSSSNMFAPNAFVGYLQANMDSTHSVESARASCNSINGGSEHSMSSETGLLNSTHSVASSTSEGLGEVVSSIELNNVVVDRTPSTELVAEQNSEKVEAIFNESLVDTPQQHDLLYMTEPNGSSVMMSPLAGDSIQFNAVESPYDNDIFSSSNAEGASVSAVDYQSEFEFEPNTLSFAEFSVPPSPELPFYDSNSMSAGPPESLSPSNSVDHLDEVFDFFVTPRQEDM